MNPLPVVIPPALSSPPRAADGVDLQAQVYQATCAAPRPLGGLMPWVVERRNLTAAWQRVSAADGADTPGPDGQTCTGLRSQVGTWLARLAEDLFHRRYRPQAPRWAEVPKPDRPQECRRLGILTIRDRVVQAALKQVLEPVLEPIFLPTSFGFRPGRSVAGALATAARALSSSGFSQPAFLWAVPLDVADCFPTIDHALLLGELARHVADADVLRLVAHFLETGGASTGRLWWQRTCGLVQGGALSPLLCNLALHPLDRALAGLSRDTQEGILALRYADDLLLLTRESRLAERGVALVRQVLRQRFQKVRGQPEPGPAAAGVPWLGVRLQPRPLARPDRVEYGYVVPAARVQALLTRLTDMTQPPSEKIDASAFNLARWIVSVNDQLRDWRQAYLYADNAADLFRLLDDFARERVAGLLHAVTGTPWPELRRHYRARLPRGFWTWEVPGARLCVLSSLAPHAPDGLTRRPLWMRRPNVSSQPASGPKEG